MPPARRIVFAAVVALCLGLTAVVIFTVASMLCGGLRVNHAHEHDGLDLGSHGESGYKFYP